MFPEVSCKIYVYSKSEFLVDFLADIKVVTIPEL